MENSPFGRLPGEIRNMIYRIVLYEPLTIRLLPRRGKLEAIKSESCQGNRRPLKRECRPALAINVFATCRTMRAETFPLYFHINAITIYANLRPRETFVAIFNTLIQPYEGQSYYSKPLSVTIWLGELDIRIGPYWLVFKKCLYMFEPEVLIRFVIGMGSNKVPKLWPESFEKFGRNEFAFFFGHWFDAVEKLFQLIWLAKKQQPAASKKSLDVKYALKGYVAQMRPLRVQSDLLKLDQNWLPSDLDSVYDPKILDMLGRAGDNNWLEGFERLKRPND